MSSYENYAQTAGNYDRTRIPVGVELILGCLSESSLPLDQQILLDAGCGTGNYSNALLKYVLRIVAVDLNRAMLDQARRKLEPEYNNGRIQFHQSRIDKLPIKSEAVHGIMINQVLHHLNDQPEKDYPMLRGVLREFARVLKPGGVLVINTCSRQQLAEGFWYYHLIPEQVGHMQQRHVPLDVLHGLLRQTGFEHRRRLVPVDGLLQGRAYFDAAGPLDKSWRDGDSMWSTLPAAKLEQVLSFVAELQASKKLEQYMLAYDAPRQHIGQLTFMYSRKV